eukprot:Partr_v1_DN26810_c0_g1_i1_m40697 putative NADH dehydrogenase (ubiquinone) Fe-S protein 1, 75kDa (NADH-coenzyme Q reductase)
MWKRILSTPTRAKQRPSFSTSQARLAEVEIFVDGKSVKVEQGAALIQACEKAGATIPRFCYHERLAVAGNCRMCLVEVERSPKPVASCAFPITPGMKVFTDTPLVHKAREGVMEFLLSNHPLDCPICDQGGECDLQDQSIRYGSDRGRFREFEGKRAVENKNFGPLVKTTMTRCIHCTRCVRFSNEVAGADELGTSGRGNDMQIGMYIDKALNTEMSGNVIDLCPVGALTSKPYEYKSRPWELKKTESIDVLDAIGSNIRIDSRGVEVLRILPRLNEAINEEWINDKTRFACDGLKRQRLMTPLAKQNGELVQVSWANALKLISKAVKRVEPSQMAAVAGQLADVETMVAAKDLFARLGSRNLFLDGAHSKSPAAHKVDFRSSYTLNSGIAAADEADAILLIGTNPRHEGAIFNTRIRKAYLHGGADIALIGEKPNLNYEVTHIGKDSSALDALEKSPFFARLSAAKKPMIVVGSGAVESDAAGAIYKKLNELTKKIPALVAADWNGVNILQRNASFTGAMDIGFYPGADHTPLGKSKFVYLLGADDLTRDDIPEDAFVVYQGHHGDVGAQFANIVLPGAAYTEKSATFVNTEGRPQLTRAAVTPPGDAREDWKIIRALSEVLGATLPYDDDDMIRERMSEIAPHLTQYGVTQSSNFIKEGLEFVSAVNNKKSANGKALLKTPITDFYLTDSICRSSSTMAKCSTAFTKPLAESKQSANA